jgi:hypothetical protein
MARPSQREIEKAQRSHVAMLRPANLKDPRAPWTRAQVTEVVLRLLEHKTGLDLDQSYLECHFVRDLRMG